MSKICEYHPGFFTDPISANEIISRIKDELGDKPRISNHCCSALEKLAGSYSYMLGESRNCITPFFFELIQQLISNSLRQDC